jgi:hypothetical protein
MCIFIILFTSFYRRMAKELHSHTADPTIWRPSMERKNENKIRYRFSVFTRCWVRQMWMEYDKKKTSPIKTVVVTCKSDWATPFAIDKTKCRNIIVSSGFVWLLPVGLSSKIDLSFQSANLATLINWTRVCFCYVLRPRRICSINFGFKPYNVMTSDWSINFYWMCGYTQLSDVCYVKQ